MGVNSNGAAQLDALLQKYSIPDEVVKRLKGDPFHITNLTRFANFFESKSQVKSNFCELENVKIKDNGVIADLTQAWREAEADNDRNLKRKSEDIPMEDMDEPLRKEIADPLEKSWWSMHGYAIPATWRAPPGLLGRIHREFIRKTHVHYIIKKISSLGQSQISVPARKKIKLGDADLTLEGNQTESDEIHVNNCFGYLHALKILMHTMAIAGCYKVSVKKTDADGNESVSTETFAPMAALMEHLAAAEAYAITHLNSKTHKFSDQQVLGRLRTIDETIREEWATRVRGQQESTLGEIQKELFTFQKTLWLTRPDNGQQTTETGGKVNKNKPQYQAQATPPKPKPTRMKPAKGNGKDKAKGKGKGKCRFWNTPSGCSRGQTCPFVHACSAVKGNGKTCGSKDHNIHGHRE